jgi:carboxymethylenebutenolidase
VRSDVTISVPIQLKSSSCAGHHPRIRQPYGRPHCSQQQAEVVGSSTVDDDEACELVSGSDLVIGEGDDSVSAYLFKAVKNNNGTGILLLSDIFGFEDSATRDFAYRVACNGYKYSNNLVHANDHLLTCIASKS